MVDEEVHIVPADVQHNDIHSGCGLKQRCYIPDRNIRYWSLLSLG